MAGDTHLACQEDAHEGGLGVHPPCGEQQVDFGIHVVVVVAGAVAVDFLLLLMLRLLTVGLCCCRCLFLLWFLVVAAAPLAFSLSRCRCCYRCCPVGGRFVAVAADAGHGSSHLTGPHPNRPAP